MELNNSFPVRKHIFLKSTHSTNEFAHNVLSKSNPKTNYSIYTYNQTDGRGQIGRFWFNGTDNNLALSLIICHVKLNIRDQFLLNIATSLGVTNYLMRLFPDQKVTIKWPNDIYIDNKKIAGILIQNQLKQSEISSSIIGIGLNVNQNEFPKTIPNPISMFQIEETNFNLLEVKLALEKEVRSFLAKMLIAKKLQRNLYYEHLYRRDEKHLFEIDEKQVEGKLVDVDEEGKLILLIEEKKRAFNFRELKFII